MLFFRFISPIIICNIRLFQNFSSFWKESLRRRLIIWIESGNNFVRNHQIIFRHWIFVFLFFTELGKLFCAIIPNQVVKQKWCSKESLIISCYYCTVSCFFDRNSSLFVEFVPLFLFSGKIYNLFCCQHNILIFSYLQMKTPIRLRTGVFALFC